MMFYQMPVYSDLHYSKFSSKITNFYPAKVIFSSNNKFPFLIIALEDN